MQVSILTCPHPAQSMSLKDGDILLVRLPEGTPGSAAQELLERIVDSIRTVDQIQIHVVASIGDFEIEHLDEKQMKRYGWVRDNGAH